MTDGLTGHLRMLAAPLADALGLELVDLQVRGSGPRQLVRVVVDRKGGVDVGTCQRLSEDLSARLDDEDPIEDRYALEVTSPGVDHPLVGRAAFDRVEGRPVRVQRRAEDGRPVQVDGTVRAAEADAVVLEVDGGSLRIPYEDIVKATQRLPW